MAIHSRGRHTIRNLATVLPAIMFLAACTMAAMLMSCCRHRWYLDGCTAELEPSGEIPDIRVRITREPVSKAVISSTDLCQVMVDYGKTARTAERISNLQVRKTGQAIWMLGSKRIDGQILLFQSTVPGGRIRHAGRDYRGDILLVPDGNSQRFFVHNHVDLESYIASVVACELYSHFHIQAYLAQAVAARTYAVYEMSTWGKRHSFDVWNSVRSQVYKGSGAETEKSRKAALMTKGWVLAYGPPGDEKIFLAQFSSCNGGHVNPAKILREISNPIAPLEGGQKDNDSLNSGCSRATWKPVVISKQAIYRALASRYKKIRQLGSLMTIEVSEYTSYGRPVWLSLAGPGGRHQSLRAEDLRLALLESGIPAAGTLYSMNCRIRDTGKNIEFYDGKGFGHGVDMSQWGAQKKAVGGQSAEEILKFYYPGARIFRAY